MEKIRRRDFGKTLVAAGAAAMLARSRVLGANDRIRLGFIGLGNRGDQVLTAFLTHADCEVTAISDLHPPYLDHAAGKIGGSPARFQDYRKLLDLKDLDAVVIATPDHWHALMAVHACQAGKDVYVEKPLSLTVAEGRKMVETARRTNRVTQVGIMRRSSPFCKEAADLARSGALGKITVARSFHIQNEWPHGIGDPPDSDPPPGFDWDAWLGPAPHVRYNRNRTFYKFRWFYDYSGGQLTNFGVHYTDFIHWSIGHDAPLEVAALGGKFAVADNREIPDTLEVVWRYPDDILVTFSQFNATAAPAGIENGLVEIRGTKGTLYLRYDGYRVVPDKLVPRESPALSPLDRALDKAYREGAKPEVAPRTVAARVDDTALHARNFLDCVRSRARCNCDIETGHRSTVPPLIGNIAHKTKSVLEWDARAERFANNDAANRFLNYKYRAPYHL